MRVDCLTTKAFIIMTLNMVRTYILLTKCDNLKRCETTIAETDLSLVDGLGDWLWNE